MRLFFLLSFIPALAFAGQIPVIDGVVGGVRSSKETTNKFKSATLNSTAVTPGALRYTENSGICGMFTKSLPQVRFLDCVH
jgi:hypothetical protein